MLVVGLTGNIASGKSTVAQLLVARGVPLIDADVLAREAVAPGSAALSRIAVRWPRVLAGDGSLDRGALRRIVFASAADRAALDAIMHPGIARRREELLAAMRARGERIVVCDIPLLFETGLDERMDTVVLVDAPESVRLERLTRDRGLPADEAKAIVAAQMPSSAKRQRADFVIDNDGSLAALAARVDEVWRAVDARAGQPSP